MNVELTRLGNYSTHVVINLPISTEINSKDSILMRLGNCFKWKWTWKSSNRCSNLLKLIQEN